MSAVTRGRRDRSVALTRRKSGAEKKSLFLPQRRGDVSPTPPSLASTNPTALTVHRAHGPPRSAKQAGKPTATAKPLRTAVQGGRRAREMRQ